MRSGAQLLWAWLPALVAAGMTFPVLGRASLTTDELATWSASGRSWSELARLLHSEDAVFTLYYAAMHLWVDVVGQQPWALRLPSALAAIATVALVTHLGRLATGRRSGGLVAGLLLALNPFFLYYAIDARPYALVALIAVVTSLLLLTNRPGTPWSWAALSVLGVWLQLFYALIALVQWAAVLSSRRYPRSSYVVPGLVVVGLTVPDAWLGVTQRAQVSWLPHTHWVGYVMWWQHLFGAGDAIALLGAALALLGALGMVRSRVPSAGMWIGMTALPALALLTVSWLIPLYDQRYVIESAPAAALLIAHGATTAFRARVRSVATATAAITVVLQASPAWAHQHRAYFYENAGAAAADIMQVSGPHSALVAVPGEARAPLYYYFDRNQDGDLPFTDISVAPDSAPVVAGNYSGRQRSLRAISAAASGYRQIVLVTLGEPSFRSVVERLEKSLLRHGFVQSRSTTYGGLTVDLFDRMH